MIVRQRELSPIDFSGLRIFDYTQGKDSSSSLALIEVPPGARHAEAYSERSDKYYLVIAGSLRFTVEREPFELQAGDFRLIPRGRRFSYSNDTAAAAKLVLVHTPSFDLSAERFVEE